MVRELKISEAKKHPANFLYIFAGEKEFLQYLPVNYANIIRTKKDNQNWLLLRSAKKYKSTYDEYVSAIHQGFIDIYNVTPAQALIDLASGKNVAGKNWSKGIFGVGAVKQTKFVGTGYSVDPSTGEILDNGVPQPVDHVVYKDVNGKATVFQKFVYDNTADTMYMAQLDENTGNYFASTKTNDNTGEMLDALGNALTASDSGSMWENIIMFIGNFIAWLITLFSNQIPISEDEILPNQEADGFVSEAGLGEAGAIVLALAAGGILLASSGKKKKS